MGVHLHSSLWKSWQLDPDRSQIVRHCQTPNSRPSKRPTFSSPALATNPLSGWQATDITTSLWLSKVCNTSLDCKSHMMTLWSSEPVIKYRPEAVRAEGIQYLVRVERKSVHLALRELILWSDRPRTSGSHVQYSFWSQYRLDNPKVECWSRELNRRDI